MQDLQLKTCSFGCKWMAKNAGVGLQKMQVLPAIQNEYSDPLHAVDHCKKCSESAVGFVPQWKPSIFAVKILAV